VRLREERKEFLGKGGARKRNEEGPHSQARGRGLRVGLQMDSKDAKRGGNCLQKEGHALRMEETIQIHANESEDGEFRRKFSVN